MMAQRARPRAAPLLAALLVVLATPVAGRGADLRDLAALVSRHLDASGGLARLRAVTSIRETGTVTLVDGGSSRSGPFVLEEKRPRKSRVERTIDGVTAIRAYDGRTAWAVLPGRQRPEVLTGESARALEENDFDSVFVDHAARGITIELAGLANVGQARAYKLKVTRRESVRYSYIDKRSFLELRRDYLRKDGRPTSYQLYRGHKTVAGLVRPTVYELGSEGEQRRMIVNVEKTEINPDIPDARFALPR